MDLNCKKRFNTIRKKFISGDYDKDTIIWMVDEIRDMICSISSKEFCELIEIPRSVLQQDLDIYMKDYPKWQKENKNYFYGNIEGFKEDFFIDLSNNVREGNFYIEDMIKTIDYMKSNFDVFVKKHGRGSEIPLRNVESTIRDAKVVNYENLMQNGDIFARVID
jgi:hypothetical protein